MKYIQTLISDGMSMNSLKPSINAEAESSLDSCIMKETPGDDCILSKELHSQNNGDKELCLTDYDIGAVENAAKKMFEQVDLNSSRPNSEVPLKKDSWNSETMYDNSSEKENMDLNDVLSDDDSNESIHLKISSEDENSILDSETNEPNSIGNNRLDNSIDDFSRDVIVEDENNSHSEVHNDLQNYSNCASEEDMPSDKDVSLAGYEIEGRLTAGDSDHEDISEVFEPVPSCAGSPEPEADDRITSDSMVNEDQSTSTSQESSPSAERDSDILDTNLDNDKKETITGTDQNLVSNDLQSVSKSGSSPVHLSTEDAEMRDMSSLDNASETVKSSSRKDSEDNLNSVSDAADSVQQDSEKDTVFLSDDAIDSDRSNSQVNGLKINDSPKIDEDSSNECVEEDEEAEEEEEAEELSSRTLEEDSEPKDDECSANGELDNSVKEGTLIHNSSPQRDIKLIEEVSPLKESTDSEEKFLEILEYQPMNEEGEELREIQSDKEPEVEQRTLSDNEEEEEEEEEEDGVERLEAADLVTEKELETDNSPSLEPKDSESSSPKSDVETSPFDSLDQKSTNVENSNNDGDVEIDDIDDNDKEESGIREIQKLTPSNEIGETNKVMDSTEDLEDIECVSEIASAKKQESLPQTVEVQSGRKRTSSNEENLVNCSKRTKVAVTESENEESDVLMSELPEDSDSRKKCTDIDTKEKCDSRTKRLSNLVDDAVEMKKIRVMPEISISDKNEKPDKQDNSTVHLDTKKSSEKSATTRKESGKLERYPMLFLRTFNRAQFQNLSRNDLEELILQKMCEAVTQRSRCGELRELAQTLEEKLKSWQKKCLQLTKQVKDLNVVLKRYGSDLQSKGPGAIPVRITRSVGLQVQMPGVPNNSWNPEESTKRKSEKPPPPVPTTSVPTSGTNSLKASSPVTKPTSSVVQKVSDGGDVQGSTAATRNNSPSISQTGGVKALQAKSPVSVNSSPATPNKTSNKSQSPVNNRAKSSDLQVIDLTDGEDKTKNNPTRLPAVSSSPTTTSVAVPNISTTVTSSVNNTTVTTVGIPASRSIRVVQPLGTTTTTPILAQSGANAVAGQRVAYFVPSTNVPVQPRQLIISSPSQVRPAGVVSGVPQRQNPIPTTIVLKPGGQVVPVSPVGAGGNIIRAGGIGNPLQITSRGQPRTGQIIQRFPVNATPVQSSGLSVVQSSGLTVSSVSHPAPLPATPTGPSNANWKLPPPKPDLKISKVPNRNQQGIVLSWNMTISTEHENIASYQLFAYQEGSAPPSTHLWKKVGDVTALPLPMACTLTQFMEGHKYHFAVRAVDVFARCGPFSAPGNIVLSRN